MVYRDGDLLGGGGEDELGGCEYARVTGAGAGAARGGEYDGWAGGVEYGGKWLGVRGQWAGL